MTSLDRPDSGSSASRPIGIAAIAGAAFASAVVAVLMATLTIATSRPSDHELQRAAAQEIGVPTVLFRVPGVQALVDEVSDRVAGRVIVESKPSIGLGVVVDPKASRYWQAIIPLAHAAHQFRAHENLRSCKRTIGPIMCPSKLFFC